jgi:hypothetical protein
MNIIALKKHEIFIFAYFCGFLLLLQIASHVVSTDIKKSKTSILSFVANFAGNLFFFHHLSHFGEGLPQLAYNQAETQGR